MTTISEATVRIKTNELKIAADAKIDTIRSLLVHLLINRVNSGPQSAV